MSHWLGANDENTHNDSSIIVSSTKKEEEACIEQWKRSYTCAMETMGYLHQLCSSSTADVKDIHKVASSVKQLWKQLLSSSSSSSNDPRIPWCHWNYATLLTSTCTCTTTTTTQKWISSLCNCMWHNNDSNSRNNWRHDYQEALHHYLQSPWNTSTLYAIITTLHTLNDDNYNFILSHLLKSTLLSPSLIRTLPVLTTNNITTTDNTGIESMVSTTNHNWYKLTNQLTSSNDTTIMMKFQPSLPLPIQFYIYSFLLPKKIPTDTTEERTNPNTTNEQQQQQQLQEEEKGEERKQENDVKMQEEKGEEIKDNDMKMQETKDKETTETKEGEDDDVNMNTQEERDEETKETKPENDDNNDTVKMESTTKTEEQEQEQENNDMEMETSEKPVETSTTNDEEQQRGEPDMKASDNKKDSVEDEEGESREHVTKAKTKKTNNWIRSSKRVQSQLLSDNKQALRRSKRNSVEYCLFSILRHNPQQHPQTPPSSPSTKLTTLHPKRKGSKILKQTQPKIKIHHKDDFMSFWNFCSDFGFQTNVPTIEVIQGLLLYASNHVTSIYNYNNTNNDDLSNNLLQLISIYSQRDGRYHSTCPGWISSSKDDSSISLLHAELRMHRYLYYQNEASYTHSYSDYYDDDDEFVLSNIVFKLVQEYSCEKRTSTTNKEETARFQIRTHWLAVMYYLQFLPKQQKKYAPVVEEKSVLSEGEEEEEEEGAKVGRKDEENSNKNDQKQALKHVQTILHIFSKHNIISIPQQHYYNKQSSPLLLDCLSYETMKEFQNELEISTILSRVRDDFQQCQNKSDYEVIYHTLRNRYIGHDKIDDDNNYEKQLELFNDFIHIHRDHLEKSLSSRYTNKNKDKAKKKS